MELVELIGSAYDAAWNRDKSTLRIRLLIFENRYECTLYVVCSEKHEPNSPLARTQLLSKQPRLLHSPYLPILLQVDLAYFSNLQEVALTLWQCNNSS